MSSDASTSTAPAPTAAPRGQLSVLPALPEALPNVQGTDPRVAVYDGIRTVIAQHVSTTLGIDLAAAYSGVDYGKKGEDFTVAVPRFRLKGKPDEIAKRIVDAFTPNQWIEKVVAQPPFVHFTVRTPTLYRAVLGQIHNLTHCMPDDVPAYGSNDSGKGKKLVLEYSSPNIAKQFHVGHLRSTIIGAFLANLYRAAGWDVISLNYLGDWGKQFGLIAVGFERYGDKDALETDAIKHLFDVYVKINKDAEQDESVHDAARAWFRRMEDGEEDALANWRLWRALSVSKYEKEYAQLNVKFDEYIGESTVSAKSQDDALNKLGDLNLTQESNGALVIDLEKYKLNTAVVRKRDGTSLYLTRDIGGAIERWDKYKFDKMIYVISSQQDLHVAQFFKVLQLMGFDWADRLENVNYGLVLGMSTRRGTVVFLEDIVREAATVMHEQMQKNEAKYAAIEDPETTSREIGISAVKIQDMSAKRIGNYNFAWERMVSFEGDTGPYLQYAHVRLSSIERKNPDLVPLPPPDQIEVDLLTEPQAREIVFLLGTYPDVVRAALKTHEPSAVVTFAMRLSHSISSAWEVLPVKQEENLGKKRARLWLFVSARDVLGAAMRLLTLTPLQRM
ncbi:arginyl-tRNA synthetase [Auriculariales sp. MPI-PUGE-AT-0066]|nr:arginyl-tRNA synthetase [Auriculariales sp. MPI-PUGE-AT-0066]